VNFKRVIFKPRKQYNSLITQFQIFDVALNSRYCNTRFAIDENWLCLSKPDNRPNGECIIENFLSLTQAKSEEKFPE
jgi:hypothetical protein